jgi:glycerol 3-phosphatase-2
MDAGEGGLRGAVEPLVDSHDLVMFDLDGVVYVGDQAVPGVAGTVDRLRRDNVAVAFVTNNASRTPDAVAAKLSALGVAASAEDVVTSAQAAASLIRKRFGGGVRAYALGGQSLSQALEGAGVTPVSRARDADVVVSGYGPEVLWRDIMEAARVVASGVPYVASNADLTIPTAEGLAPGHGVLVRTICEFAGVDALVAGKPEPPLMEETISRVGGLRPLMVGDRLDTDIEGANRLGIDSLLVLTGVAGLADLVSAPPPLRPTHLAPDTAGLFEVHGVPLAEGDDWSLGGWRGSAASGELEMSGAGEVADWWRVAVRASWAYFDATGTPVDISRIQVPRAGDARLGR